MIRFGDGGLSSGEMTIFNLPDITGNVFLCLLKSNGLLTSQANTFINQDIKQVLSSTPEYVNKMARFATETKAKIDRLLNGDGRRKRGRPKGSKNKTVRKIKYKPKL